jgi:hypothetical protein
MEGKAAGDSLMMKLGEAAGRLAKLDVLAPEGVDWALAIANRNFNHPSVRRDRSRADLAHTVSGPARLARLARLSVHAGGDRPDRGSRERRPGVEGSPLCRPLLTMSATRELALSLGQRHERTSAVEPQGRFCSTAHADERTSIGASERRDQCRPYSWSVACSPQAASGRPSPGDSVIDRWVM